MRFDFNKTTIERILYVIVILFLAIICIFLVYTQKDVAINEFQYEGIGQETSTSYRTVTLKVIDKTRLYYGFTIPVQSSNACIIKLSSENELYNETAIYVSKDEYNNFEIGNSYEFTLTEITKINRTLEPQK